MKAVTVSYRRLVSDGGYCNRALEVTLELEEGDTYANGIATVKKLVDQGLERTKQIDAKEAEARMAEGDLSLRQSTIELQEAALAMNRKSFEGEAASAAAIHKTL